MSWRGKFEIRQANPKMEEPAGDPLKVLTPADVIKMKPKGKVSVEVRVAEVGIIRALIKKGEETEPRSC
jgi:hypothetical protein